MDRHALTGQRLVAIFLIGVLLVNYPLLSLFSVDGMLWGIPVLYIYIFTCWLLIIAAMALLIEGRR
jgi:hypothetical protein